MRFLNIDNNVITGVSSVHGTATGILLARELNNQLYFWAIPVVSILIGLITVVFIYRELRRKAYERA